MKTKKTNSPSPMRVGLVVPHIFMQEALLPHVIFSPAALALELASELQRESVEVTLFTAGPVDTPVRNITADLSYFEKELKLRGDSYLQLLKKHPFTFITLARQVQAELIAKAYAMANAGELDIVHVYTNEEELALPFAALCTKPVVFTHHDPFNFMVKYKSVFPKYRALNWIAISESQRREMPADTNWVGTVYHGLSNPGLSPVAQPDNDYVAYLGRIIEPKGVHLAIKAVQLYNQNKRTAAQPLRLKIAGKHYSGHRKDSYWTRRIEPHIDQDTVEYTGFIGSAAQKRQFLANAQALIVPSLFSEPFGMVSIEALACATPVIGLDSGALPEIIQDGVTGYVVPKIYNADQQLDESKTSHALCQAISSLSSLPERQACRDDYEKRFGLERMARNHKAIYRRLIR